MAMVMTTLGLIPDSDLHRTTSEKDEDQAVMVACEWTYTGTDPKHASARGTVVRRDVWANLKRGLESATTLGA